MLVLVIYKLPLATITALVGKRSIRYAVNNLVKAVERNWEALIFFSRWCQFAFSADSQRPGDDRSSLLSLGLPRWTWPNTSASS